MDFTSGVVGLQNLQVKDAQNRNAVNCEVGGWHKKADQGWNDDGYEACRLLFKAHHWVYYGHGMR